MKTRWLSMRDRLYRRGRRHRVVTPWMPWMTAQDATCGEIAAAHDAVVFERFFGVAGTARIEPTVRPEHRTHQVTIQTNQSLQDGAHCFTTVRQCRSRLRVIAALSASRAPARALTTRSTAGNSCVSCGTVSRPRRLMRLRRTALQTMRAAIANPRRGTGAPVLRANIAKKASAERRASRYTRSNSDFCRRR